MIIVPAIYPETFEEIADKIYVVRDYSKLIQINICDGSNGLRTSWLPITGREILPTKFNYEFDLMVTLWRDYLQLTYDLGARRMVVHVDTFTRDDYQELFTFVHEHGITIGLTVSNDVSVDMLVYAARQIEESPYFTDPNKAFIQVTGVRNLSENDHPFDERVLPRIRVLKNFFPTLTIQVSGRMNPDTVKLVKQAGADRLVVGSYIFGHEDVHVALDNLRKALQEEAKTPDVVKEEVIQSKEVLPEIPVIVESKEHKKKEKYDPSKDELLYDVDPNDFTDKL